MDNMGDGLKTNKKVLVSGASGFVGKTLLTVMKDSGWEIIPLVPESIGFKNEIIIDLNDPEIHKKVDSLPRVDSFVHLGAVIGWAGATLKDLMFPNVIATAQLAGWAAQNKVHFIFASAALVCGITSEYINENSNINPDNDYICSKWLAEEFIKMSDAKYTILRIAGVFGKDGPKHLGINKAINNALGGHIPVQYGSGNMKRNYIYVKDLCLAIKYCIDNSIEGTHLIAGSHPKDIACMMKDICDVFLPGKLPDRIEGHNGFDQVVEHSKHFPANRSFLEALQDIKNDVS